MFAFTVLVVLAVASTLIIRSGHTKAVQESEAIMRAKFNSGEYSAEARTLMQKAGYRV